MEKLTINNNIKIPGGYQSSDSKRRISWLQDKTGFNYQDLQWDKPEDLKGIIENHIGYFSFAAPYQELIEEFTMNELINFHFKFLNPINKLNKKDIPYKMKLEEALNIKIKNFSSGMKQKLKLGLALYSDCSFTLLDEPCTNLDKNSKIWYQNTIENLQNFKKIIIATNSNDDFDSSQYNIIKLD